MGPYGGKCKEGLWKGSVRKVEGSERKAFGREV